jgi:hypothetical protein
MLLLCVVVLPMNHCAKQGPQPSEPGKPVAQAPSIVQTPADGRGAPRPPSASEIVDLLTRYARALQEGKLLEASHLSCSAEAIAQKKAGVTLESADRDTLLRVLSRAVRDGLSIAPSVPQAFADSPRIEGSGDQWMVMPAGSDAKVGIGVKDGGYCLGGFDDLNHMTGYDKLSAVECKYCTCTRQSDGSVGKTCDWWNKK